MHIPFTRVSIGEYKTCICLNNSLVDGAVIEVVKHGLNSCVRRLVMDVVLNRRIWINEVWKICGCTRKDSMLVTVFRRLCTYYHSPNQQQEYPDHSRGSGKCLARPGLDQHHCPRSRFS